MVRIIEGSKTGVSPGDLQKEVQDIFGKFRAYMGQKGAVLASVKEREYLSTGGSTHNTLYHALSREEYEFKGLGTVNVELLDSSLSTGGDADIHAKVTITGSDVLKKGSNLPENIKNILTLDGFYLGSSDDTKLHDKTNDEELAPIRAY